MVRLKSKGDSEMAAVIQKDKLISGKDWITDEGINEVRTRYSKAYDLAKKTAASGDPISDDAWDAQMDSLDDIPALISTLIAYRDAYKALTE